MQHLLTAADLDGFVSGNDLLFRKVFQYSNDAILIIDPDHDLIIDANPAACSKLGYMHSALLQLPLHTLFGQHWLRWQEFAESVLKEGHGTLEDIDCVTLKNTLLPVEISASSLLLGEYRCFVLLLHDLSRHRAEEQLFHTIAQGIAALTGDEFFRALVKVLAQTLAVDYAFVSEFTQVKNRVRALAYWTPTGYGETFEYDLDGTPCEAVLKGEIRHYQEDVRNQFRRDQWLTEIGAESFLAIPLMDTQGNVFGHLAAIHTRPMAMVPRDLSLFRIFGGRATVEVLRQQAERRRQLAEAALRASETRLSTILASALDAVITFDDEHHIVLFNTAAEKIFRCSAEWARGQPFDRFLSKRFRSLLESYLKQLDDAGGGSNQLWAPDGLTALRADGEEFPIETTISPMRLADQRFYTVILRDVDERLQAEQTLRRLAQENRYLQDQLDDKYSFENIVGNAGVMRGVFEHIQKVAAADTTVLLLGETGTGKELIASAIHNLSPCKGKLLVKMNCAALPSELIESELFGHEKGAFTGATTQRKGRFELADGGTLFLDEVGELSLPAQAKLLRVLQEQEFERVGGSRPIKVDARVIAATNRDLAEMVKHGEFRADLYYRLNVFPIRIPPLRERHEDIPVLARHFLQQLARKLGKPLVDLTPRSLTRLQVYPWPGNVRELQNVIERAAILASGPLVDIDDALDMRLEAPAGAEAPLHSGTLEDVERSYITQVLDASHWTIEGERGAAAILDLHPSTLRSRMQKLNIKRPQLR